MDVAFRDNDSENRLVVRGATAQWQPVVILDTAVQLAGGLGGLKLPLPTGMSLHEDEGGHAGARGGLLVRHGTQRTVGLASIAWTCECGQRVVC